MCGTLDILSDLCEVRLSFPVSQLPRLQLLVEFSDGTMLELLNEMMSESRMNLH